MLNFFLTKKVVVRFILFYSFFTNYLSQKGFCAPSDIEVRYHWIRDAVRKGLISPSHIPSEFNISDILTKPLDRNSHTRLTSLLGLS